MYVAAQPDPSPAADSAPSRLTQARTPPDPEPAPGQRQLSRPGVTLGWRRALRFLASFEAAVLLFAAASLVIEIAAGDAAYQGHFSGPGRAASDAVWHVATALVLVLPTRNRATYVLGPVMALGFDIDHVFGAFLPVVTPRPAHDVFFLVLLAVAMYQLFGRFGAFLAPGIVLAHIAVDGGGFPFFAPLATRAYPLSLPEQMVLLAVGALLIYLSVRPLSDLRDPRHVVPWLAALAAVGLAVDLLWPLVQPFTVQ